MNLSRRVVLFSVALGVVAPVLLSGCASTKIRHLTGAEFVKQAEMTELAHSFVWFQYVGSSWQRAYLEYSHPAFVGEGYRTTVYWTELSELPEDLAAKLKAGSPPWKPWVPATNRTEDINFRGFPVRGVGLPVAP